MKSKGYSELARKLGVSRQSVFQRKKTATGKCGYCGNEPLFSKDRCKECHLKNRIRIRKRQNFKPWKPGGRGRPPIESRLLWSDPILDKFLTNKEKIQGLSWALGHSRQRIVEMIDGLASHHSALRDLLAFYDRAAGAPGHTGHGWSVAEVLRLEEIRKLACPERSEG